MSVIILKRRQERNKRIAASFGEIARDGNKTGPKESMDVWSNPVCTLYPWHK